MFRLSTETASLEQQQSIMQQRVPAAAVAGKGYCWRRGRDAYNGLATVAAATARQPQPPPLVCQWQQQSRPLAGGAGGGGRTTTSCALFSSLESIPHNNQSRRKIYYYIAAAATISTGCCLAVGVYTRHLREEKIERELPLASSSNSGSVTLARDWMELRQIVQRAGLMGQTHKSVKAELEDIRKWHTQNGFKGGLVVRDVTVPLFGSEKNPSPSAQEDAPQEQSANEHKDSPSVNTWNFFQWFKNSSLASVYSLEELLEDPMRLARRECYYLYYEIQPTGRHVQQIFCRGTTLGVDILTCLQAWTVYDEELQCRVHRGFRDQADRVVADLVPLLAPPHHVRATVELAGHSLGGAVAAMVAGKLRQRGYRVVRLTTIGEPAYVATYGDAQQLRQLLPADHVRVENDRDFVPFLPPTAKHVGDKLWFPNFNSIVASFFGKGAATASTSPPPRYVTDSPDHMWTESFWLNFCVPEILLANGRPHRIPSYLERLDALTVVQPTDQGHGNSG